MQEKKCHTCPARDICFQINSEINIDAEDCIGTYYYEEGYKAASKDIKKNSISRDKEIEQWIKLKAWANDSDIVQTLTRIGYNKGLKEIQKILEELFYEARSMYEDIDELLFYIRYRLPEIFKRKQKSL